MCAIFHFKINYFSQHWITKKNWGGGSWRVFNSLIEKLKVLVSLKCVDVNKYLKLFCPSAWWFPANAWPSSFKNIVFARKVVCRCEFKGKNYNLNWSKTNCSNFTRNLHESWDVNSHSKNSSLLACVTPGLDAANFWPWPELTARSPKVWQLLIYSHSFVQI